MRWMHDRIDIQWDGYMMGWMYNGMGRMCNEMEWSAGLQTKVGVICHPGEDFHG